MKTLRSAFKLESDHLPSLKTLSIISFALLIISMPLFAFTSGVGQYVREYFGLVWHLSMFFFIWKLPVPEWGKHAGTYWIILDVLSGILYINNFYGITGSAALGIATQTGITLCLGVRLAAHCFQGIWFISSALTTDNKIIKWCGVLAGVLLAGYSLLSPFAPSWGFDLNAPFVIVWFIMIVIGKY